MVCAINSDPWTEVPYLVMEYVAGTSLRSLIARSLLPADDAWRLFDHAGLHVCDLSVGELVG